MVAMWWTLMVVGMIGLVLLGLFWAYVCAIVGGAALITFFRRHIGNRTAKQ